MVYFYKGYISNVIKKENVMNKTEEDLIFERYVEDSNYKGLIGKLKSFSKQAEESDNILASKYFQYLIKGVDNDISYKYDSNVGRVNLKNELYKIKSDNWKEFFDITYDTRHPVRHVIDLTYF